MSIRLPGQPVDDDSPITRDEILAGFHRAAKPPPLWRVGVEFERFAVHRDGRPLHYAGPGGIEALLSALNDRCGWEPIRNEGGHLTALHRGGASVSLEPGGQLELATSPVVTLRDVERELDEHLAEVRAVAPHVVLLAAGAHPLWHADDLPLMPRVRHAVMAEYLPARSPTALDMMKATASTQVALDFADEADAMRKLSAALRLSPLVNALWANGPVYGRRDAGVVSHRGHIWRHMDPDRAGHLVPLLEAGPSFEGWADLLLDVPMMFTCIDGRYRPAGGRTFRGWMADSIDGRRPTAGDWDVHLTTVFPEVRLKRFLEVRGADANARPLALAVPAVWKGLLYGAIDDAGRLADELTPADLPGLFEAAYRDGLAASYRGRTLAHWGRDLVALADCGLPPEERRYLDPVREVLERGRSPGMAFRSDPAAGVDGLIERFRFDR